MRSIWYDVLMKKRILEIDCLRGLAILGMVIYHVAFMMMFFDLAEVDLFGFWWQLLARVVQFVFLGLVGVSVYLSRRMKGESFYQQQKRRFLILVFSAVLVTIGTYLVVPEAYVRFGILHLIALSILVLIPLADKPKIALLMGLGIIAMTPDFNRLIYLQHYAIDFFSPFPWLALPLLGIVVGSFFYKDLSPQLELKNQGIVNFLSRIGKKSLIIYLLHVPLIYLILHLFYDFHS